MSSNEKRPASLPRIFGYAMGEGGISITMNGIGNFAMLYFTQVLGLSPAYASIALSITTFWDAVTDPVMGYISDNTRTRIGRRHPFLIGGALVLAVSFFLLWFAPQQVSGEIAIFGVVLVANLALRTAVTVFAVPFTALGFEICPEYEARSKLQGIRFFVNMIVNFTFGAMAWVLFFQDTTDAAGERVDGTLVASNYLTMGATLAFFVVVLSSVCILSTWRFAARTNIGATTSQKGFKGFWKDFNSIFRDRLALFVFAFFMVAQLAMMLMGQVQMFTYVFYMEFVSVEKTAVHGAGMLSFAFCSLLQAKLVHRFDKKRTGYIGGSLALFGCGALYLVFIGGLVAPQASWEVGGFTVPVAVILFGVLQSCWWGGSGMMVPLASSMIADVAAINHVHSGKLKNAGYAAVFTFCQKTAISIGLLIVGSLIAMAGIESGADEQTAEATRNIAQLTFIAPALVMVVALLILHRYPVTREYMAEIREKTEAMEAAEEQARNAGEDSSS